MSFKRLVKQTVTSSLILRRMVSRISGDMPRIFVYHRFTAAGETVPHRISADTFAWQLDRMQEHGKIISLASCLEYYYEHRAWPTKTVVVTVDDGYRDFYQYAFPELKKRNLPATFFTTVNFIEQSIWLWPDRLEAALATHEKAALVVDSEDGGEISISYSNKLERSSAWWRLVEMCIASPDDIRQKIIQSVESQLEVVLPDSPTKAYEPCTWEDLRMMTSHAIEILSHTMNHPILSKVEAPVLESEVQVSKLEIEKRIDAPVKTFCYPNSAPDDINDKVVDNVKRVGYLGAVFGVDQSTWEPYCVPRFATEIDQINFLWKLCGGESFSLHAKN